MPSISYKTRAYGKNTITKSDYRDNHALENNSLFSLLNGVITKIKEKKEL